MFFRFISALQTEVLRAEFLHFSLGNDKISPLQFSNAILRYAELSEKLKERGLKHVAESIKFEKDSIDFESYCSFFNLLFRLEDLYSALKMYMISNRAISKGENRLFSRLYIPVFDSFWFCSCRGVSASSSCSYWN